MIYGNEDFMGENLHEEDFREENLREENLPEPRKVWNWVWLSLFFMAFAILLSENGINQLVIYLVPQIGNTDWYVWALTAIGVVGIGFPVFYFLMKRVPDSKHRTIEKMHFSQFLGLFFICTAAMYLSNIVGLLVNQIIAFIKGAEVINPIEEAISSSNIIFIFLYGAVLGPIIEELIFRKILLNKVRRYGDWTAIIMTGLAFGLFHMNLSQFFYATVLGMIFAYITIRTNTVRYAIYLHILINFSGSTVAPFVIASKNDGMVMMFLLWTMVSVIIGIILIIRSIKKIRIEKGEVEISHKTIIFLNPGMICFTLLCIAQMVYVILQ